MEQFTTTGFLHLTNVPGFSEKDHFETIKKFHALPDEIKHKLKWHHHNKDNDNFYRGLSPILPNDPSHKELFDVGASYHLLSEEAQNLPLYEETPFPTGKPEYDEIRREYENLYNLMHQLSLKIIGCLAVGLGKDRDFFLDWFEHDSLSTMRSIHYLPRSSNVVDNSQLSSEDIKLTTPEHTDSGFITILTTFGYPGL